MADMGMEWEGEGVLVLAVQCSAVEGEGSRALQCSAAHWGLVNSPSHLSHKFLFLFPAYCLLPTAYCPAYSRPCLEPP